jgi:GT2 family glycosyltransferase
MTARSDVAAVMVAWNSMRWLPAALDSLEAQSCPPASITVVDNASADGVQEYIEARHPRVKLLRNAGNEGFARAVNQGIEGSREEWVLVLNPDLSLEPGYLEELLRAAESRPDAGALGGVLLRPDGRVDSAGLELRRYLLRPLDRETLPAAGESGVEEVFGICAAAALYRRAMLEDVAFEGEYMDATFFAYYEDVDLAWRAAHRGWKSYVVPAARGMHVRGASGGEASRAGLVRSQRNRYLAIFKNLPAGRFAADFLPVAGIELGRLLRHPGSQWAGLFQAARLAGSLRARRDHIQRTARPGSAWYLTR